MCKSGKSLDEIGIAMNTDKRSTFHGFLHHYDRLFARDYCKQATVKILELGVYNGGSIAAMVEYYGSGVHIIGVDHHESAEANALIKKALANNPGAKVELIMIDINNNMGKLKARLAELGPFDVILDDAQHSFDQQFQILKHILQYVKPGGWFITEDLHTSLKGERFYFGGKGANDGMYQAPLDAYNAIRNPQGGVFKPTGAFSEADLNAVREVAEEVVIYYHRNYKTLMHEGLEFKPFTSVTGVIRVKQ